MTEPAPLRRSRAQEIGQIVLQKWLVPLPDFSQYETLDKDEVSRLWTAGDAEELTYFFDEAVEAYPDEVAFHIWAAVWNYQIGAFDMAFEYACRAYEIEPSLKTSAFRLHLAWISCDAIQAKIYAEEVLFFDSCHETACLLIANFYIAYGCFERSREFLGRLLLKDSSNVCGRMGAMSLRLHAGHAVSWQEMQTLLLLYSDDPSVLLFTVGVYSMRGEHEKAWQIKDRLWSQSMVWAARTDLWDHPQWDGKPFPGKTLLITYGSGCGFGDVFQLVRFIPQMQALGGHVLIAPPHYELVEILVETFGDIVCDFSFEMADWCDFWIDLEELPRTLRMTPENLPNAVPYLKVDCAWQDLGRTLSPSNELTVGVAWGVASMNIATLGREPGLREFAPLAKVPHVRFVSLQKGPAEGQLNNPPPGMQIEEVLSDDPSWEETASIIQQCDVIVAADNAVANLSGALGRPVWVALKRYGDYRWHGAGGRTPWYPSARVFEQPFPGQWAPVFDRIAEQLAQLVAERERLMLADSV